MRRSRPWCVFSPPWGCAACGSPAASLWCADALPDLVAALHAVPGIEEINLTTNGILFSPMAGTLKAAGIHGINFSLDTLSPETFARITRTDRFSDARGAIDRALELGFDRVKVQLHPHSGA